jgi:hypothetical protein
MRRHVLKVGLSIASLRNPVAIVDNPKEGFAALATANDADSLGVGVDAVFDKFRDGLQRIRLRKRNDIDGVPVVADAKIAARISMPLPLEMGGHGRRFLTLRMGEEEPAKPDFRAAPWN